MSHRILLVETDRTAALVAEQILGDRGYRVSRVDCFADAVRQTKAGSPDLIITALRLGAFNGLQLLLRSRAAHGDVPAIVMTMADDFTGDVAACGARAVLKPVAALPLLQLVEELLAGRPAHDSMLARSWPRKRAALPATVRTGAAHVVEVSYGGLRLHLSAPPGAIRMPLAVRLPTLDVSVDAIACWSHPSDEPGHWWCGAEIVPADADAERTWRWIVNDVN